MSCSNCGSITAGCGCTDPAYTTPVASTCVPACPPKCAEYTSATCVLMNDGINELGSNPGDTLESIIQRITLILTNPLCVDWIPGSGGGGGGGIVSVGLVTSSNLFDTPIAPVTTPGGDLILNLSNQSANTVFAGPASGPDDTPAFRSLVLGDLPALTSGSSLLMGNGSGFFANVTIGAGLTFSGGVLSATATPGNTYTANNGLTESPANNFRLGGTLLTNTSILGSINTYDLSFNAIRNFQINAASSVLVESNTNLDHKAVEHRFFNSTNTRIANLSSTLGQLTLDGYYASTGVLYTTTPAYSLGVDNLGNVLKVPFNTAATGDITADNGITANTTSNTRLGGPLIQNTFITGGGSTFDISIGDPGSSDPMGVLTLHANSIDLNTPAITASTAVNGQVFKLIDDATGEGEWADAFTLTTTGSTGAATYDGNTLNIPNYSTASYTASNGITPNSPTPNNFKLGGTLIENTTIAGTTAYRMIITSAKNAASTLTVSNTDPSLSNPGSGLTVTSAKGDGIIVSGDTNAITSTSVNGYAIAGSSTALGTAVAQFTSRVTGSSTVARNTEFVRELNTGTVAGFGQSLDFLLMESTGSSNILANQIISKWTNAVAGTATSQFEIWGLNNAVLTKKMSIAGSGQLTLDNYTTGAFSGSPVSYLGVDSSGNVITGPGGSSLTFQNSGTALTQRSIVDITGTLNAVDSGTKTVISGPTTSDGLITNYTADNTPPSFKLGSPLDSLIPANSLVTQSLFTQNRYINLNKNRLFITSSADTPATGFSATATISGGQVTVITINNPGTGGGYTVNNISNFIITGGSPSVNAAATFKTAAPVGEVVMINGGSNYPVGTTAVFPAPSEPTGVQATGTPIIKDGAIVGVNITNPGSGYTADGSVTFSGSPGAGATARFSLGKPVPFTVTITNPGSGYASAPSVTISPDLQALTGSAVTITNGQSVTGSLFRVVGASPSYLSEIVNNGGSTGYALRINHSGNGNGLQVFGNSSSTGIQVSTVSSGVSVSGATIGLSISTFNNSNTGFIVSNSFSGLTSPYNVVQLSGTPTGSTLTQGTITFNRTNTIKDVVAPTVPNNTTDISGVGTYLQWSNPFYNMPRPDPPTSALFTGSISGNTLTVTSVAAGSLGLSSSLNFVGVLSGTFIIAFGSGSGGAGTYTLSVTYPSPIASISMTAFGTPYNDTSASGQITGIWRNADYSNASGGFDFKLAKYAAGLDPRRPTWPLRTVMRLNADGQVTFPEGLPTSSAGLVTGDLYTQTTAQLGIVGGGSQKVVCIV